MAFPDQYKKILGTDDDDEIDDDAEFDDDDVDPTEMKKSQVEVDDMFTDLKNLGFHIGTI